MIKGIFGQKGDYKKRMAEDMAAAQYMQQPEQKTSFFGEGGPARGIAGALGDVLLQHNGISPIYAPHQQQQQQMQFARDRYEQRRADDQNDWIAQEQWKRDNPVPQAPTAQQRNFEYYQGMDDAGRQTFEQYLDAVTPKLVTGADGRTYPVRRPGARPAVGSVIKDPRKVGPASAPGNFRK